MFPGAATRSGPEAEHQVEPATAIRSASDLRSLVEGAAIQVESAPSSTRRSAARPGLVSVDARLGRLTTIGAAFIAVAGRMHH